MRRWLQCVVILQSALAVIFLFNPADGHKAQRIDKKSNGDGGSAIKAQIDAPAAIAFDREDNLFIAQADYRVRKIDAKTGVITTIAGNGKADSLGDNGPAVKASIDHPTAIAIDASGNVFIGTINGVRRIDARTGIITTVDGRGKSDNRGVGDVDPAASAHFRGPDGLATDGAGNLFIAGDEYHRVRRLDGKTGIITIVAGGGDWHDPGDGKIATKASFGFPSGIVCDKAGNLFVCDYHHHRIRRVDARTQIITTIAGTGKKETSGDGGPAIAAGLAYPHELAIDGAGNLFVDGAGNSVRRIDARTGTITTVAGDGKGESKGDGGLAEKASLNEPASVAIDSKGNLFIAEYAGHRIRRVDAVTGIITTVAGNGLPHIL